MSGTTAAASPGSGTDESGTGRSGTDGSGTDAPLLAVRDLRVTGPAGVLVAGVDLTVRHGETLAVVGESGSGKSLTARALCGLLPAGLTATGAVTLGGRPLDPAGSEAQWREVRGARVALVLQDPFTSLSPVHTCGDQIGWAVATTAKRGRAARAERAARVATLLAEVGLPAATARRHPHELSGGMRQRVAIAAALAADPELLIADEPTTALDVTTQHEVLEIVAGLQRRRRMGVLLITHDLRLARARADRVQVMYAGRLLESGPAAEVLDDPAHPYTAALAACEPPLDRRLPLLRTIPGAVPAAHAAGDGCAFAPRCAYADDACRSTPPALRAVAADAAGPAGAGDRGAAGLGRVTACLRPEALRAPAVPAKAGGHGADVASTHAVAAPGGAAKAEAGAAVGAGTGGGAGSAGTGAALGRDAVLTVRGLTRRFPGAARPAVDAVDLDLARGEAVAVVGQSGSGKTTLARCVVGLERADAGSIAFAPGASGPRRVQIVFQDPYSALNPGLSVGTGLAEALAAAGRPRSEVPDLLRLVGLPPEYARRRPRQMSGGERQRVAIARALAPRADVLVCDESVSALDVSVQAGVLNLLSGLRRSLGLSLLFITHDLAVARQVADRVYVMHEGVVVESGPADRLLSAPEHDYTRGLLAAVPGAH